jgi:hypothetical protein
MTEPKQAAFEGWAVVEMFGHAKEIGFVTTEVYGSAVLFRVDTPALPEREFISKRPDWSGPKIIPIGAKVKREAVPAKSRLVGPGAIYSITPCTEETAMYAIEELIRRPLILVELPGGDKPKELLPGETEAQNRTFSCCAGNPEDGHADDCTKEFDEEEEVSSQKLHQ